ncbi:MAG TPA: STAS domain-containing protein [Gemmatimonadales bacterium]|nr:STAS domain-containing protein [Gemmatimonadales bacterium]
MTRKLGLSCEVRGTIAEVLVSGDLDMAAAFKLEPAIERVVAEHSVQALVLDLADVSFIDSAGVGSLLSARDRLNDLGVNAHFTRPSKAVERVLDVGGIRHVVVD